MTTFIEQLPARWEISQLFATPGRINMLREGVVTLVGVKRLESEALFVSSEGGGTLRETAKGRRGTSSDALRVGCARLHGG
jgi:hypothetical protein